MFQMHQQWPKVYYREFCIKFWLKSFYANNKPTNTIDPNHIKSANLKFYQFCSLILWFQFGNAILCPSLER